MRENPFRIIGFGAATVMSLILGCGAPTSPTGGSPTSPDGSGDAGIASTTDAGTHVGDAGASSSDDAGTEPVDAGTMDAGMPATGACAPGSTVKPGTFTRTITSGGRSRSFHLYIPSSISSQPTMLVLNFHGYTSDGSQQAIVSQMNAEADKRGFVVAYPNGVSNSWNGGLCCGTAMQNGIDDVQFARDLVAAIGEEVCVDARRVYSTGLSNGGFLSYRLACEASDLIAAIAPVAGVMGVSNCNPARHVPVMHFHGTSDSVVLYDGGQYGYPSVASTYQGWLERNDCSGARTITYQNGDVTCETRDGCPSDGQSVLCTVYGGGHTWPGGTPVPWLGATTNDIDATSAMLDFFEANPR